MIDISRGPQTREPSRGQSIERFPAPAPSNWDFTDNNQTLETARRWIRQQPGVALVVGFVTGGIVGWLTSKLK